MKNNSIFSQNCHPDQGSCCEARLIMSTQTEAAAERRRSTREAGGKAHIRLLAPILSLNEEKATKTSNQPSLSAIVESRPQATDPTEQQIISSMTTILTHINSKMCNKSSRQSNATRQASQKRVPPPFRRSTRQTIANHIPTARTLTNYLLISLALVSCCMAGSTGAMESEPTNQAGGSQDKASSRDSNERSDSGFGSVLKTVLESGNSTTSASSQRSIVASLSSAVATAAAAAAVAAAQNGLSGSDARSLSSSSSSASSHKSPIQANRPGLNLAIKLVDTIPEVHYNILHNMKKLDHAAPFYNVPHKYSHGVAKESSQNFLANALTAAGAGDQLSNLFRSPLWKRIAEGYGDFASEFRSMFRPSAPTPMRGPSSPTSKIIRDISVPALLMLLASSIGSGEWRPVRTRRKSFRPIDIPASSDVLSLSDPLMSESSISSTAQTLSHLTPALEPTVQPMGPQYFQRYERYQQPQVQQRQQQQAFPAAQNQQDSVGGKYIGADQFNPSQLLGARVGQSTSRSKDDINLLAMESQRSNWNAPDQLSALLGGTMDEQHPFEIQAAAAAASSLRQQHQQQQALEKRSFELDNDLNRRHSGRDAEIVHGNEVQLGRDPDVSNSDPVEKLLDSDQPETSNDGHSQRFMSLLSDGNALAPIKRADQLEYTIMMPEEISKHEQATATKRQPALLSAMAQAAASLLSSRSTSVAKSGSSNSASSRSNIYARDNLTPNPMISIGDSQVVDWKTMMRRQSSPAEQRDLTKLLPETWREVVKRTMTNVQQQANSQWKSIEGQLANWVQDKLKTVSPTGPIGSNQAAVAAANNDQSSSSAASSPSKSIGGVLPAPIGNMLASAGSTAMNILGLEWKNHHSSSGAAPSQAVVAAESQSKNKSKGDEQSAISDKGKLGSSSSGIARPSGAAKAALAGVANLIGSVSSKSSQTLPEPTSSSQTTNDQSSSSLHHDTKSQTLGELASSVAQVAISSVASKYPTITGPDASLQAVPQVPGSRTGSSSQITPSADS